MDMLQQSKSRGKKSACHLHGNGTYLITGASLYDHRETVVIGGRDTEDVHDGAHLLHFVKAGDWRTHDFSVGQKRT